MIEGKVVARVKREYAQRIRGNWSLDQEPLRGWITRTVALRNRVVHAGYRPHRAEAREALVGADAVEHFVTDRIAASATSYPKTALLLLDEASLVKRGMDVQRLEELVPEDSVIGTLHASFNLFREQVASARNH